MPEQGPVHAMLFERFKDYSGILDAIRRRVLDWALNLEADGILSEGLSFSQDEKSRVAQGGDAYNITAHTVVASM
jgi:hypothetical protein